MPYRYFILFCLISGGFWGCRKDFPVWGKFAEVKDCSVSFSSSAHSVLAGMPDTFAFTGNCADATEWRWFVDGAYKHSGPEFISTFPCDDTVLVTLVVSLAGLSDTVSDTIVVRPVTFPIRAFDLDQDPAQSDQVFGIDEPDGGGFYLMVNNNRQTFLAKADSKGNISVLPEGHDLGSTYSGLQPHAFVKTSTGYLLVGRAIQAGSSNFDFYVLKANQLNFSLFNQVSILSAMAGEDEEAFGAADLPGGGYVLCGQGGFDNPVGICLLKTDQNLAQQQQSPKTVFEPDPGAYGAAIVGAGDHFWLTGRRKTGPDTYDAFFAVLDKDLNPIPATSFSIGSKALLIKKIIPLNEREAVILGLEDNSARLIKVNAASGIVVWQKTYAQNIFEDGILTRNGRLIVVGEGPDATGVQYFFEIDPADGTVLLHHGYASDAIDTGRATCIAETADCGFVIGGFGHKNNEQSEKSILFKTDKNGLIDL